MKKLKKRGIDLKPFFQSQCAYNKVSYDYFKEYAAIEDFKILLPSNEPSIKDLLLNYDKNVVSQVSKQGKNLTKVLNVNQGQE